MCVYICMYVNESTQSILNLSVKLIGLFAIGLVGVNTIEDLLTMALNVEWSFNNSKSSKSRPIHRPVKSLQSQPPSLYSNTSKMPLRTYINHWLARIALLIVLPIAVYMSTFAIHFAILHKSGTGDANMSSLFQAGLIGNTFDKNPLEIAYGSRVTFKNNGPAGGLL